MGSSKLRKMWEKMNYSRKTKYKEVPTPSEAKEMISKSVYRELAVLKSVTVKEMVKWHKERPEERYLLLSIKQSMFSSAAFSLLVNYLHAAGWDVATRTFKKSYFDKDALMSGVVNAFYTVPHFEIQIAFPGELDKAIEGTDFVVFGKESSTSEKEQ